MTHQIHKRQRPEITARCSCGCGGQLLIQLLPSGEIMIDTRADGRHRWTGVFLNKEASERIFRLLGVRAPEHDGSFVRQ